MKYIILQTLFRLVNKTNSAMEYCRYISNTSRVIYNNSSNKKYRKIGKEKRKMNRVLYQSNKAELFRSHQTSVLFGQ